VTALAALERAQGLPNTESFGRFTLNLSHSLQMKMGVLRRTEPSLVCGIAGAVPETKSPAGVAGGAVSRISGGSEGEANPEPYG